MAIGFALVILDVAVNTIRGMRGRRNPWGAATLEWAAPNPSPNYGFASIPIVHGRYPLSEDPDLAVRIAQGRGLSGRRHPQPSGDADRHDGARANLCSSPCCREIRCCRSCWPSSPARRSLPRCSTPTRCLGPCSGRAWSIVALIWVWGLAPRKDEGLVDIGHGMSVPLASESDDPPGWWGSLFLLLADGVQFGSLLFGYAFLWTVAPNWPPPSYLRPEVWAVSDCHWRGRRACRRPPPGSRGTIRQGKDPRSRCSWPESGLLALAAAAVTSCSRVPRHPRHAYDATLWLSGGACGVPCWADR